MKVTRQGQCQWRDPDVNVMKVFNIRQCAWRIAQRSIDFTDDKGKRTKRRTTGTKELIQRDTQELCQVSAQLASFVAM